MQQQQEAVIKQRFPLMRHLTCAAILGVLGFLLMLATNRSPGALFAGTAIGALAGWLVVPDLYIRFLEKVELPARIREILPMSNQVEQVGQEEIEDESMLSLPVQDLTRTAVLSAPVVDTTTTAVLAPSALAPPLHEEHEDDLFSYAEVPQVLPFRRLTLTEVVQRCQTAGWFNDFHVVVGRSLSLEGGKARRMGFYKKHIKVIGISQFGKSSLVAYLIDAITQTHDTAHVQLAILDMEDMTGQLFANLPHIASVEQNGRTTKLHARTVDEVFDHLGYLYLLMEYRYKLPMEERMKLPLLIVYFEEFLAFKNKLKEALSAETQAERELAKYRYATFMNRLTQLMTRGLKARIQFLLCAQLDYADEDLREALRQATNGFAFCLAREAAQAAGFRQTALISENEMKKQKGQCVAELEDFNDIILVPEYDLEARLLTIQQKQPTAPAVVVLDEAESHPLPADRQEQQPFYLSAIGGGQVKEMKSAPSETLEEKVRRAFSMNYTTLGAVASFCSKSPGQIRPVWEKVRFEIAEQQREAEESEVS